MYVTYGTVLRAEVEQSKSGEVPCRQTAVTMACFQKKDFPEQEMQANPFILTS